MKTFIKSSGILLSILLLSSATQLSFAQAKLVQTFIEQNNVGNSEFGYSVSGAGDVNNDTYDDVIVGAPFYNSNMGRVYIYYGGNPMDATADLIITGEGTDDQFGYSVSRAGLLNNDSYYDVIVGAPGYKSDTGRVYIYFGGSPMNAAADMIITGQIEEGYFGASVSGAGNVNGDSFDDVIVGSVIPLSGMAYIYYGGNPMNSTADVTLSGSVFESLGFSVSSAGDVNNDNYDDVIVGTNGTAAYIYYGGNPMNNTPDKTLLVQGTSVWFGYSVSGAGDVNNDTYDDVIVGSPGYSSNTGRAYVYYGGSSMDTTADVVMTGEGTNNFFGSSVSGAGDVNGTSYDDVIVGAYGYNSNTGRVYIFYGSTTMNASADRIMTGEDTDNYFGCSVSDAGDVDNDTYYDVIVGARQCDYHTGRAYIYDGGYSMDTTVYVKMRGEDLNNKFGFSVSNAGDVNNDKMDDVIIGTPYYYANTGRAYIYYGGNPMDSEVDVIISRNGLDSYFGWSVSGAGDVNNDGYDDVIIGAYGVASYAGRAYIFYGSDSTYNRNKPDLTLSGSATDAGFGYSVSNAGNVNNDRFDDVIVGAVASDYGGSAYIFYGGDPMDNTADVSLQGQETDSYFGCSVSDAGDVNNDTYDDVIVGAYRYNAYRGRAYIFFGGSTVNNIPDVILTGEAEADCFGISVSGAGDVNNDTFDDVIVGAYGYYSFAGSAYIFYGGSSMNNTSDVTMTGEETNNNFGWSVSGVGDINNDNYADIIVGAYGYNSNTGRAYIYYGGNPMDNSSDITMTGEGTGSYFGYSVSDAGDVNKDGYNDFIVGAYGYPVNGKAYIYSDPGAPVSVKTAISLNPDKFELLQNYPNPFNPSTTIIFSVGTYGHTSLRIYDMLGREVTTLINEIKPAGSYQAIWNAADMPSGIYFASLEFSGKQLTRKLLLIK